MKNKKFFSKYWWILPAVIAFSGMIASTFPSVEFTRNFQLGFLALSILAAFGWFTRPKEKFSNSKSTFSETKTEIPSDDDLDG